MINDNDFYEDDDMPDNRQKNKMWKKIEAGIKPKHKVIFNIKHLPSFYYGMAASFLLIFSSIGLFTTAKQLLYEAKPGELKLNTAYQSAVKEFERVIPVALSTMPQSENTREYITAKKEQLNYLDAAIEEIKRETGSTDLTPLKQIRLRQLYFAKLKVLQEIIDKGEVEL